MCAQRAAPAPTPGDRPTPAVCTLLLAAHGSRRRPEANAAVHRLAATLSSTGRFGAVAATFAMGAGAGALPPPDARVPGPVILVPYLMTDGFLARRLADDVARGLAMRRDPRAVLAGEPVGTHPGIAGIAAGLASRAFQAAGLGPESGTVVIIAHGSPTHPESKRDAARQRDRIAATGAFAGVTLGLLEEPPFAADAIATAPGPVAVVGLFAAPGGHAVDDIGAALAAAGRGDAVDAGFVGADAAMAEIVLARARAALMAD